MMYPSCEVETASAMLDEAEGGRLPTAARQNDGRRLVAEIAQRAGEAGPGDRAIEPGTRLPGLGAFGAAAQGHDLRHLFALKRQAGII
jgi:hypothetical protein